MRDLTDKIALLCRRIAATIIDIGIIWACIPILTLLEVPTQNPALICVLGLMYQAILDASIYQGSIGKRCMNLLVTSSTGTQLSFHHALIRNGMKLISILPAGIGIMAIFFTKSGQPWHDIIAKAEISATAPLPLQSQTPQQAEPHTPPLPTYPLQAQPAHHFQAHGVLK